MSPAPPGLPAPSPCFSVPRLTIPPRCDQAGKLYQNERDTIEAQYNDAREQIVQRFLFSLDERRRKLREEKEGGDVISGMFTFFFPFHSLTGTAC